PDRRPRATRSLSHRRVDRRLASAVVCPSGGHRLFSAHTCLGTLRATGEGRSRTRVASGMDFPRIKRLPPYVFNVVSDLKLQARRAGEDIVDFSMGNPDGASPPHVVEKLIEAVRKPTNHRYSVSRGIYKLRVAICDWYKRRFAVDLDPDAEAIVTMGRSRPAACRCRAT